MRNNEKFFEKFSQDLWRMRSRLVRGEDKIGATIF